MQALDFAIPFSYIGETVVTISLMFTTWLVRLAMLIQSFLFAPPPGAPTSVNVPGLSLLMQEERNWCYAACTQMVEVANDIRRTQCDIATRLNVLYDCCGADRETACNIPGAVLTDHLNTRFESPRSISDIRAGLRDRKPVILNISWDGWESHFVVVAGFSGDHFMILDPGARYGAVDDGLVPAGYFERAIGGYYDISPR